MALGGVGNVYSGLHSTWVLLLLACSSASGSGRDASRDSEGWELRSLPRPQPWLANQVLLYVRVQKTGSKSLVDLLGRQPWLRSQSSNNVSAVTSCPRTGWIGERTSTCSKLVASALRRQKEFKCAVDGHCSLDTLTLNRTLSMGRQSGGARVITLLRDPFSRVLSEFRHVCGRGTGQWDYSTRAWRDAEPHPHGRTVRNCSDPAALRAFLETQEHDAGMHNRQVRMLAGALAEPHEHEPRSGHALRKLAQMGYQRLEVVLLSEHWHLSLILLSFLFAVKPPTRYRVVREKVEGSRLPPLSKELRDLVAERNQADKDLHVAATRQFIAWIRKLLRPGAVGRAPAYYHCSPKDPVLWISDQYYAAAECRLNQTALYADLAVKAWWARESS